MTSLHVIDRNADVAAAEGSVIAAMMIAPTAAIPRLRRQGLSSRDFYSVKNQIAYRKLSEQFDALGDVVITALAFTEDEARTFGGLPVSEMARYTNRDIPDIAQIEHAGAAVMRQSRARRYIQAADEIARLSRDCDVDAAQRLIRSLDADATTSGECGEFMIAALQAEPDDQEYTVDRLIPADFPTILFGPGGSRKSFLAVELAFHVCLGRPIFGHATRRAPVLFLDGELDRGVFLRRSYAIANGLGVPIPRDLVYYKVTRGLTEELPIIRRYIAENRIGLTIIDSFSACVPCEDSNSLDQVALAMKAICSLGTTLVVDHVKKSTEGDATPFGSVAKVNFARSVLQIAGTPDAALLKQVKSNFDSPASPIAFTLNVSTGFVGLEQLSLDDARIEEAAAILPAESRILAAFEGGRFANGATVDEVADALDIAPKTTRNKLAILVSKGKILKDGNRWVAYPSNAPVPRALPLKNKGGRAQGNAPLDALGHAGAGHGAAEGGA